MHKKHSSNEIEAVLQYYKAGIPVKSIVLDTGIPRSTIYGRIRKASAPEARKKAVSQKDYRLLKNKVIRLEGIIEIMKRVGCCADDPLEIKLPALEALQGEYSVHMLCEALDVPRGTYYNYILRGKHTHPWYARRREALREEIQRIYDESNQVFGSGKICAVMKENGVSVSKEDYYFSLFALPGT